MPYIGNPSAQRFTSPRAASVFSGDGSTVEFTLDEAVSTDEDILVSVDGVIQEPSVAYSVSNGTTLTFTGAPSSNSGNNIFVYYIARTFGSVSMPDGQNVNAATLSTSGNVVFNEASADVDFRVESNGDANMINVDGGNDVLGIKTATPTNYYADDIVLTAPDEGGMTMVSGTSERAYLAFADGTSGDARYRGYISYDHNTDQLILGAGGSGRLLIDGNGIITKAAQVSFSAKASGSQTNIAVGSTVDVVLATEHFDRNADFASNVFTAPLEGLYQLNGHFYLGGLDSGANYIQAQITTSNRNYVQVFSLDGFDQDFSYLPFTISVLADMDASDTAQLQLYQGGGSQQIDVDGHTRFTGYLVC